MINANNFNNGLRYLIFAVSAFVVFLNPYLASPIPLVSGQILVLWLLIYYGFKIYASEKIRFFIDYKFLVAIIAFFLYPHSISFLQRAELDLNLLKIQISVLIMVLLGFIVSYTARNYRTPSSLSLDVCNLFVFVIVINSLIILLEFYIPSVRVALEALLTPDRKIDYANGLRFRGLASAGGASLSVAHGISVPLLYYLFRRNCIGPLRLMFGVTVILLSLIFIGRTGFVVALFGFLVVIVVTKSLGKTTGILSSIWFLLILIGSIFLVSYLGVFYDTLPAHYQNYSINLFLDGAEGLKSEGTVSYVFSFYSFPDDLLAVLFGRGDFSGGFDHGYDKPGDPGVMKILTAYGLIGVLIYVGLLLWCFSLSKGSLRTVLIICGLLLMATEFKEPFLFKGYSSRLFWLLIGFSLYSRGILSVKAFNKSIVARHPSLSDHN